MSYRSLQTSLSPSLSGFHNVTRHPRSHWPQICVSSINLIRSPPVCPRQTDRGLTFCSCSCCSSFCWSSCKLWLCWVRDLISLCLDSRSDWSCFASFSNFSFLLVSRLTSFWCTWMSCRSCEENETYVKNSENQWCRSKQKWKFMLHVYWHMKSLVAKWNKSIFKNF